MASLEQLGRLFADEIEATCHDASTGQDGPRVNFISSREFVVTEYHRSWLVRNVLAAEQPAIVGGGKKTLKTSMLVDLAVSLGTGGRFLGRFAAERCRRVGLISGESGEATIQETFRRICQAKGITLPEEVDVHWAFKMPRLSHDIDMLELREEIETHGLEVVILDPLYLGLLADNVDVQASNLYQIDPLLAKVANTCLRAGATPILDHHTKKHVTDPFSPPELEDLAFAGVQEFARQWLLIGRREKYEPGTGEHKLWLNVGGSTGHSGCWAVDINEGTLRSDFSGRTWRVLVHAVAEERQLVGERKVQEREQKLRQRDIEDRERLLQALRRFPRGETFNAICESGGLNKARAKPILDALVAEGRVVQTDVLKGGGRGERSYPGFRLVDEESDFMEEIG